MLEIGFIGAGNMGSAIMRAAKGCPQGENICIRAFDPDAAKLQMLEACGVVPCVSEQETVKMSKYVFLAVKPQVMDTILETIAPAVGEETVLVSIAAGITGEYIRSRTRPDAKVILAMPNTPLMLGEGAVAVAKCANTTDEEFSVIQDIFNACGIAAAIPEDKMKEIIAINGSSPAFIYRFAQLFIDYADSEGIDSKAAVQLFARTLIGSAKMITDSGYTLEELIRMVSSPGGTTLAGLDALEKEHFGEAVNAACTACTKRAYELSK